MSTSEARGTDQPRKPGPPPRLSRDEVLTAALAQIRSRGLAGLTMRRLADELGLGVMTLYNYFRTKEDLLDEVCGHALSAVRADLDPTAAWDTQITTAIRDLHEALADNPGVVDIFVARSVYGPTLDHVRETLLAILRRAGFPKRHAVLALGSLVSYAVGFTLTERARSPKIASQSVGVRFQNLSDDEFPYLSDAGEDYLEYMSEGAFEYGLGHLVNSLRAELESLAVHPGPEHPGRAYPGRAYPGPAES